MAKKLDIQAPKQAKAHGEAAVVNTLENGGRTKAQPKKQLSIRIPVPMFEDLEALGMNHKINGQDWSTNELVTTLIGQYLDAHRTEIEEFRERNRPQRFVAPEFHTMPDIMIS